MLTEWASPILFTVVAAYTPGPNNFLASHSGFNFGFKKSIPLILGVAFGWTTLIVLLELGLILVFKQYSIIQKIIQIVGTLFVVYLAYKISFSKSDEEDQSKTPITFFDTFIFQFLNPKGVIFATVIVATYIKPEESFLTTAVITFILFVIALTSIIFWTLLGKYLRNFATSEKFIKFFNYSMSFLLIVCIILFYV
ncbi:MAG: LysE family translocator [Pelagibacteraceae bacterium]|jgi:threonine/homoserine/homoserine lactone efflux protein